MGDCVKKFIKRLFRCPPETSLIILWVVKVGNYAIGQTETTYKLKLGMYTILRWTVFFTPQGDWNKVNQQPAGQDKQI